MNIKKIILINAAILAVFLSLLLLAFQDNAKTRLDITEVNDVSESLASEWDTLNTDNLPGSDYGWDYVVLDSDNELRFATAEGLNTSLNSAIANRDTIVDIRKGDELLGKMIIFNDTVLMWQRYKRNLIILTAVMIIAYVVIGLVYTLHINASIILPFRKLQQFARHVAAGNLDIPLQMDKGNMFGAFTESFDLMREELYKARENEAKANQSKKELVASLSHDIKTPVASIKAVSEIMMAKTNDEYEKKQLENINLKADQINTLITNLFNATLEELQELKVTVTEQPSLVIFDLIGNADYNHLVTVSGKPECIVLMDQLRLSQVIDNVISNSYKYANTAIDVTVAIRDNFLEISFLDYGPGVSEAEKPFLFHKFYRGKNAEGKNGTGLGLYISKYLMNKMSGDIECENTGNGFRIILKLLLA
jgi:signal transduction histidine kinase